MKAENRRSRVVDTEMASGRYSPAETLAGLVDSRVSTLLVLDAPLGWPEAPSRLLPGHRAGPAFRESPESLFSRCTDRFVRKIQGKAPLEVGSDRIARTGWATLRMIEELEQILGRKSDLAWSRPLPPDYVARSSDHSNWVPQGRAGESARGDSLGRERENSISNVISRAVRHTAVLDAVPCVLAADDFLRGDCIPPEDNLPIHKEGWIWVKRPFPDKNRARASFTDEVVPGNSLKLLGSSRV